MEAVYRTPDGSRHRPSSPIDANRRLDTRVLSPQVWASLEKTLHMLVRAHPSHACHINQVRTKPIAAAMKAAAEMIFYKDSCVSKQGWTYPPGNWGGSRKLPLILPFPYLCAHLSPSLNCGLLSITLLPQPTPYNLALNTRWLSVWEGAQ